MEWCRVYTISPPEPQDCRAAAVIVAAGHFTRMGGIAKQMIPLCGKPVIAHTIAAFQQARHIREIVLVARKQDVAAFETICREYGFDKVSTVVTGGNTRQESVFRGIEHTHSAAYYAIHDGARPLITPETIDAVVESAWQYQAATVAVRVKDTMKLADDRGFVQETPPRDRLWSVQTPQVFEQQLYCQAAQAASKKGYSFTDDCQLAESLGHRVYLVEGDYTNLKITTPEDIAIAEGILTERIHGEEAAKMTSGRERNMTMRIGHGYDVHRLAEGETLIIGGVRIPYEKGLLGHSDADVLAHAVMDALLGAAAMGDIGGMFPDTDSEYRGADSLVLMRRVVERLHKAGWRVSNVDATIIAQAPKLKPYIDEMRQKLAQVCAVELAQMNVKATTEEHLGFTGDGDGIAAHAVCLLEAS